MDEATARLRLESMIGVGEFPELELYEVDDLVEMAKRADADDRDPSDPDWQPTWNLDASAAEGWRRKAGKVASRFNVNVDGDALQRAQVFAHCLSMADIYGRRIIASAEVMAQYRVSASDLSD